MRNTDKGWALPEQPQPPDTPIGCGLGSTSSQGGVQQLVLKGIITPPAQKVITMGGHRPPRGSLAFCWVDTIAMSSAPTARDVATHMELPGKYAATQALGCRTCQSLSLVPDGSSEHSSEVQSSR